MVQTYTCRGATRRWPLALFYNMLDIAALNAYTIFRKLHLEYKKSKASKRKLFITELAESLIMPHMKTRQKIPRLQKPTKEEMIRCGVSFACLSAQSCSTETKEVCSVRDIQRQKGVESLLKILQTCVSST